MRFVKRQLELSFCSNGLYRKETGNLDESLGFTGYLCECLSHAFDVFLSTSAHFLPAFWLKYFKIPLCFFHFITVPGRMLSMREGLKN